jgi:hypothetical protein
MSNVVLINGVQYQKNEPKQKQSSYATRRMLGIAAIAAAVDPYGHNGYGGSSYFRQRPAVDIVKEYELIQQKKSKLSRSDREWVIRTFESNYTKMEDQCS